MQRTLARVRARARSAVRRSEGGAEWKTGTKAAGPEVFALARTNGPLGSPMRPSVRARAPYLSEHAAGPGGRPHSAAPLVRRSQPGLGWPRPGTQARPDSGLVLRRAAVAETAASFFVRRSASRVTLSRAPRDGCPAGGRSRVMPAVPGPWAPSFLLPELGSPLVWLVRGIPPRLPSAV